MPEPGAPVRLAFWLDCGHRLSDSFLVGNTRYDEDDDRLMVSCAQLGCGYTQPARGSREVLAELYCQVTLRDAREVLAVPYHAPDTLREDIEEAGSLWAVRKVLDREPMPTELGAWMDWQTRTRKPVPYAGHIETGTRAHASRPFLKPVKARPKTWAERMIDAMAAEASEAEGAWTVDWGAAGNAADGPGPWRLRLDLWWMRLCLRWQTGDGVRLDIRVPTVTAP